MPIVPKVYDKAKPVVTPLEKFLGREARIISGRDIAISGHIQAQAMVVSFEGSNVPDEQGKLFLLPIDDARFCLQLCYLVYGAGVEENVDVYSIIFLPAFFEQFPLSALTASQPFSFQKTTEQQFFICAKSAGLLDSLVKNNTFTELTGLLQATQAAVSLLSRALECIAMPFTVCQVPACRFLAYDSEREKIQEAVIIIGKQTGRPHTIKELARKVAMNECYLKKGFKALTGKTIHEYQQELRISKAKELLREDGYTVTAAALELGYSSIAHFSTAFKRVTGMKPCELLA